MAAILSAEWFHLLHRRQTWGVLGGTLAVLVASLLLSRGYNYHSAYLAYLAALGGGANAPWAGVPTPHGWPSFPWSGVSPPATASGGAATRASHDTNAAGSPWRASSSAN